MIKIAIDAMGGDFAPEMPVKGAMKAIKKFDDLEIVLYGDQDKINKYLTDSTRISIVDTKVYVDMGEHDAITFLRAHRDCSMVMSFTAVKNKEVDGVLTAGPTQAVIPCGQMFIRRIPGMKRTALCPNIPTFHEGGAIMLDVGANTTITPEYILQYAEYANIYAKEVLGKNNPNVYLLNIGAEEGKGRELEQLTYNLLKDSETINFRGNLEPKELLHSDADVIVTDGFTGNICLKTLEGTAKAMGDALKQEIKSSLGGIIGYIFMKKNLNRFKNRFNTDSAGGAVLFGVDGNVVKAHGASNEDAIFYAISQLRKVINGNVLNQMKDYLEKHPFVEKEDNNE